MRSGEMISASCWRRGPALPPRRHWARWCRRIVLGGNTSLGQRVEKGWTCRRWAGPRCRISRLMAGLSGVLETNRFTILRARPAPLPRAPIRPSFKLQIGGHGCPTQHRAPHRCAHDGVHAERDGAVQRRSGGARRVSPTADGSRPWPGQCRDGASRTGLHRLQGGRRRCHRRPMNSPSSVFVVHPPSITRLGQNRSMPPDAMPAARRLEVVRATPLVTSTGKTVGKLVGPSMPSSTRRLDRQRCRSNRTQAAGWPQKVLFTAPATGPCPRVPGGVAHLHHQWPAAPLHSPVGGQHAWSPQSTISSARWGRISAMRQAALGQEILTVVDHHPGASRSSPASVSSASCTSTPAGLDGMDEQPGHGTDQIGSGKPRWRSQGKWHGQKGPHVTTHTDSAGAPRPSCNPGWPNLLISVSASAGVVGRTWLVATRTTEGGPGARPSSHSAATADVRAYALNAASRSLPESLRSWPDAEHATAVAQSRQGDPGRLRAFDAAPGWKHWPGSWMCRRWKSARPRLCGFSPWWRWWTARWPRP